MAITIVDQNDLTATLGVDVLIVSALTRVFQLEVDLGNMQAGDTVVLRADIKVVAGGPFIQLYTETFTGVPVAPGILQISPPIPAVHQVRFTLEQTVGAARVFPWKAMSIATATPLASGTLALVNGTGEQSINVVTTNKTIVLLTDHGNMIAGDTVTLRLKEQVRTGGANRIAFEEAIVGAQTDPDIARISIPLAVPDRGEVTAELDAGGADHNMPFTLMAVVA